ncbi:MAG: DUF192 domain-containing protein [Armatimonadota bacterium]
MRKVRPMTMRAIRRLLLLAGMITVTAAVSSLAAPAPPQFSRGTLALSQNGRKVTLAVEVASTTEAHGHGLMFRKTLDENAGMLFIFEQDGKWGFWMRNTLIPLSIGFIDKQWRLLEILDMAVAADPQAGPWPIYEPKAAYRYALEVNQGYFQRKGITQGARLEFAPAK